MPEPTQPPSIVLAEDDLFFQVRFETAANKLGYSLSLMGDFSRNENPEEDFARRVRMMNFLSTLQPVLVIIDLNSQQFPWAEWIPILKSDPASKRIPVICFGSHKETEMFRTALLCGADQVYARSKMMEDFPSIVKKWERKSNQLEISEACQETLSAPAQQGIQAFNHRHYFEAHELLEQAWFEETGPGRDIYRALLQVSVAYLQVERANYRGAVKMFMRLRQWIDPLPDSCRGVDFQTLKKNVKEVYEMVEFLGPQRISSFDMSLLRPVEFVNSSE